MKYGIQVKSFMTASVWFNNPQGGCFLKDCSETFYEDLFHIERNIVIVLNNSRLPDKIHTLYYVIPGLLARSLFWKDPGSRTFSLDFRFFLLCESAVAETGMTKRSSRNLQVASYERRLPRGIKKRYFTGLKPAATLS